jgi:broad specificity phosphatase PhoE
MQKHMRSFFSLVLTFVFSSTASSLIASPTSKEAQATVMYIVRHGQTDWNAEKRIQGQLPVPLNDVGRGQAAELAKTLAEIPFVACYSSDLPRAYETATIIAKDRSFQVFEDSRIRERYRGKWEGCLESDFARAPKDDKLDVESDDVMQARIFAFLQETASKHLGDTILIVAHCRVLGNILQQVLSLDCEANSISVQHAGCIKLAYSPAEKFRVIDTRGITIPKSAHVSD